MKINQLEVNKDNIHEVKVSPREVNVVDEDVIVEIEKFAYTSNNTTYAVMGDSFKYWNFFPQTVDPDSGMIPCWAFGKVIHSSQPDITQGSRFYGYYPMATAMTAKASHISPNGWSAIDRHRADLAAIYNRYINVETDKGYHTEFEDHILLFRPLFATSFLIHVMLTRGNYFGADQIVMTSASSKTALGLAHCLADDSNSPKVIGLTSSRNMDFVKESGYYREVYSYEDYKNVASEKTVIVDFSGNNDLQADLQGHFGENLSYNCLVGMVHWNERRGEKEIQKRGTVFFAPTYYQEAVQEWGAKEFNKRLGAQLLSFIQTANNWLTVKHHHGEEALLSLHEEMTDGNIDPKEGHIVILKK